MYKSEVKQNFLLSVSIPHPVHGLNRIQRWLSMHFSLGLGLRLETLFSALCFSGLETQTEPASWAVPGLPRPTADAETSCTLKPHEHKVLCNKLERENECVSVLSLFFLWRILTGRGSGGVGRRACVEEKGTSSLQSLSVISIYTSLMKMRPPSS